MIIAQRLLRQKFATFLLGFGSLLLFFVLLHSSKTITNQKFLEVSYISTKKVPGAYVKNVYSAPANDSYCTFNYGLPNQLTFTKDDLSDSPELGPEGSHYILYDVLQGSLTEGQPAVTYATHVTEDFIPYIAELAKYWDGAISVAAYLSDGKPNEVLQKFIHFCYCIPEMSRVSLHLVFRKDGIQMKNGFHFSNNHVPPTNCDILESSKSDSETVISNKSSNITTTKGHAIDSWYPVNVCRNVARQAIYTDYVMVCDVELMPSQYMASRFIDMVEAYKCLEESCDKQVYVVPIFEVDASESIPRSKKELVNLINKDQANYFHKRICSHCQKFPGLEQWMESDPGNVIKPLTVTKRKMPFHRWEPIYIGTKNEPLYNEKLSWEGLQDKMLQMLEMCLMDYNLVILDGAFLVHWPGIKRVKLNKEKPWRIPFINKNQKVYDSILKNMSSKYTMDPQCRPT